MMLDKDDRPMSLSSSGAPTLSMIEHNRLVSLSSVPWRTQRTSLNNSMQSLSDLPIKHIIASSDVQNGGRISVLVGKIIEIDCASGTIIANANGSCTHAELSSDHLKGLGQDDSVVVLSKRSTDEDPQQGAADQVAKLSQTNRRKFGGRRGCLASSEDSQAKMMATSAGLPAACGFIREESVQTRGKERRHSVAVISSDYSSEPLVDIISVRPGDDGSLSSKRYRSSKLSRKSESSRLQSAEYLIRVLSGGSNTPRTDPPSGRMRSTRAYGEVQTARPRDSERMRTYGLGGLGNSSHSSATGTTSTAGHSMSIGPHSTFNSPQSMRMTTDPGGVGGIRMSVSGGIPPTASSSALNRNNPLLKIFTHNGSTNVSNLPMKGAKKSSTGATVAGNEAAIIGVVPSTNKKSDKSSDKKDKEPSLRKQVRPGTDKMKHSSKSARHQELGVEIGSATTHPHLQDFIAPPPPPPLKPPTYAPLEGTQMSMNPPNPPTSLPAHQRIPYSLGQVASSSQYTVHNNAVSSTPSVSGSSMYRGAGGVGGSSYIVEYPPGAHGYHTTSATSNNDSSSRRSFLTGSMQSSLITYNEHSRSAAYLN
eukprot:GHVH01012094.1.p1 GENE.GHVH01012094.1~~GHVH01012094.1.p1  ORF type:complete len:592 (-),score=60.27 GHVH01012094.1:39-1814(-)